jgi:hypothetical protein
MAKFDCYVKVKNFKDPSIIGAYDEPSTPGRGGHKAPLSATTRNHALSQQM